MANTTLVILLSGISKPWVQPLAFTVGKTKTLAETIQELVITLIKMFQHEQLFVKAVACDQGASNITLAGRINVTASKPFFVVNRWKVYFLFDTPHLLKFTRNNLPATHNLKIGQEIVEWRYITQLYESLTIKLAKQFTEKHAYSKPFANMKVRFASQVMSESVALAIAVLMVTGVLPSTSILTADFLERLGKLFDCLNSSAVQKQMDAKLRYANSESSEHLSFLQESLSWISSWQYDNPQQPHRIRG